MKTLHSFIITITVGFLTIGISSVFASVELDAYIPINGHAVTPIFKFSKSVVIDYPNGGKLKNDFAGKNITVEFTDDSLNNPTIKSFMEQINHFIATHGSTSSTFTSLIIQYVA
jgi:hypothetical protein